MRVVATNDIGARVQRGPDWEYQNQDIVDIHGSEIPNATGLGTIVEDEDSIDGWVRVRWDTGNVNSYRIGMWGVYDLVYAAPSLTLENVFKL